MQLQAHTQQVEYLVAADNHNLSIAYNLCSKRLVGGSIIYRRVVARAIGGIVGVRSASTPNKGDGVHVNCTIVRTNAYIRIFAVHIKFGSCAIYYRADLGSLTRII